MDVHDMTLQITKLSDIGEEDCILVESSIYRVRQIMPAVSRRTGDPGTIVAGEDPSGKLRYLAYDNPEANVLRINPLARLETTSPLHRGRPDETTVTHTWNSSPLPGDGVPQGVKPPVKCVAATDVRIGDVILVSQYGNKRVVVHDVVLRGGDVHIYGPKDATKLGRTYYIYRRSSALRVVGTTPTGNAKAFRERDVVSVYLGGGRKEPGMVVRVDDFLNSVIVSLPGYNDGELIRASPDRLERVR